MSGQYDVDEAVGLLQDLGLKEYESRCFVALSRLQSGTAAEISEVSAVPRTRVYDAVRVLEAQGLVEVQHANPQQFRAVSVEEAAATLRQRYDDRIDTLRTRLETFELEDEDDDSELLHEVWSLSGREAIETRTLGLLEAADEEIVLLVVEEAVLTETLFDRLEAAVDRGVDVVVGGTAETVGRIERELPGVDAFETELGWLVGPADEDEIAISRLLLVDRSTLFVSTFYQGNDHRDSSEQAVFATGLENGVVVLARRLIATGLAPDRDPG